MSDDEDLVLDASINEKKPLSKPSLSFCNVIVTASMSTAPVVTDSGLQAVTVSRPVLGVQLL